MKDVKMLKKMRSPKRRRQNNIAQQMKGVLIILLVGFVLFGALSGSLLVKMREQVLREMKEMTMLYTSELDNRFFRISRSLFSTMMERSQPESLFWQKVEKIRDNTDRVGADYAVSRLRADSMSYAWEYGSDYHFFLYVASSDKYIRLTLAKDGYEEKTELKEAVLKQIKSMENTSYSVRKKWGVMTSEEETYICKIAQSQDVYLGCYTNINTILTSFSGMMKGEDGYVRLVDVDGEAVGEVTGRESTEGKKASIVQEFNQAPFGIEIRIPGERIMDVMMGSLMLLLGLVSVILLAGGGVLWYIRRFLWMPVKRFTDNLIQYDEGDDLLHLTEGNLLELEQIDERFKRMLRQIKRLKITLYEQELEKQKIEMDYLKLQIRPHFYLNCLNFIYSMIDFEQYENASRMITITSDYLQYIFRNTSELVTIEAEATHCKNYLEILLLRYPKCFSYYFEIHEEVKDVLIFPFLMQVFIENAAKQALVQEKEILITLTVFPEEREGAEYANLYISDTGEGFPETVLMRLQSGKGVAKDGRHLGIENCLKRFSYYYEEQGEINFENSPLGGAIVDIHIPHRTEGKGRG